MLKLTPKANLKSLFLTGAATTATLLSPLMLKEAAALNLVPNNPGCDIANLTTSTKCSGIYQGNDSNQDVTDLFSDLFSPPNFDWVEVAKVDGNSGSNNGLTIGGSSTSGTWSYTPNPNAQALMFVLKGGPTFTAYLMTSNSTSGNWNTNDLLNGNGGSDPGLSHFAVYQSDAPEPYQSDAPEPLTLLGAASAIGFGVVFKKRLEKKRRDQDQA